jgi:hypothetical protein
MKAQKFRLGSVVLTRTGHVGQIESVRLDAQKGNIYSLPKFGEYLETSLNLISTSVPEFKASGKNRRAA